MPCVVVELLRTQVLDGPTGIDSVVQTVQIKLVYNKRDDYGSTNTSEVTGVRALESFAQGIDPTSTVGSSAKSYMEHNEQSARKMRSAPILE